MKKVKLTMYMEVTDEYYHNELVSLKEEIENGTHQKEMIEDSKKFKKGLIKYKADFKDVL
jgi:hypothetical protein